MSEQSTSDQTRAVVSKWFEALSTGRAVSGGGNRSEETMDLFADDVVQWLPGPTVGLPQHGIRRGKERVSKFWADLKPLFDDQPRFRLNNLIVEGEHALLECHVDRMTAAGDRYVLDYAFAVQVRGGKIILLKEYLDTLSLLQMLYPQRALGLGAHLPDHPYEEPPMPLP